MCSFDFNTIIVLASCPIPTLTHGSVSHLSKSCPDGECMLATEASVICEPEYHLSGSAQSICIGYGEWEPSLPICEGKS